MADHSLKEKLRAAAAEGGSVSLSSSDLAPATSQVRVNYEEKTGDIVVPVGELAKQDNLLNSGADTASSSQLSKTADQTADQTASNLLSGELSAMPTVTTTEEDRAAFVDALITGGRYCRPFSLFGGQLTGVLRCRSAEESEAIAGWMAAGIKEKRFEIAMDYSLELRNILLAAQVKQLGGTEFLELRTPLRRTQAGADMIQPGWSDQAKYWSTVPEAIMGAVYEEIRSFERKYWTMIENAANQDFWSPVRST